MMNEAPNRRIPGLRGLRARTLSAAYCRASIEWRFMHSGNVSLMVRENTDFVGAQPDTVLRIVLGNATQASGHL
nr:hypothetical protein [uncultured Roseateles sp.]